MSLLDLWIKSKSQLEAKQVQQIIAIAGSGKLLDGGDSSKEFREFLAHVTSSVLARYAEECLTAKFEASGLALQDVVNQIGRRLGFKVEDGRYRGVSHQSGHDGVWSSPLGNTIVVEVKTTDAYRVDLNNIAAYRRRLIQQETITEDKSSILVIVGRQDTGDLEAQIRGSRHAWDIRLVSIDALLRLMRLKETVEDPQTLKKIVEVLIPQEFTKIDGIIDLVFSTAEEVRQDTERQEDEEVSEDGEGQKPRSLPANFNDACAARIQALLKKPLVRQTRTGYGVPDGSVFVFCAVSKAYSKAAKEGYWYAFHPHQREKLAAAGEAYVAFGCGSEETVLLIPFKEFRPWLDGLNITQLEDRFYWHVHIYKENKNLFLQRKRGLEKIDLTRYLIK
jgi:hypothetical protein